MLEWLIVILFSFIEILLMTNAINVAQYFYYDKKILIINLDSSYSHKDALVPSSKSGSDWKA